MEMSDLGPGETGGGGGGEGAVSGPGPIETPGERVVR